ncbi:hypothetical protein GOODEAATRI_005409 [Goodea atripinnis]|uniref:Uncharacterized protein n=1 Tax=Goodea atripinnis TaxID=208336 RepID=A0ABV0MQQ6_9TELE
MSLDEKRYDTAELFGHQRKGLQGCVAKPNCRSCNTSVLKGCREGKHEMCHGIAKAASTRSCIVCFTQEVIRNPTLSTWYSCDGGTENGIGARPRLKKALPEADTSPSGSSSCSCLKAIHVTSRIELSLGSPSALCEEN